MRLMLVGHGRMGKLVEVLAPSRGFEVAIVLAQGDNPGGAGITDEACRGVDVAIDFSVAAAVPATLAALAARRVPAVIGTTGWRGHEPALRRLAAEAGIGVVAAANFSFGANLLEALAESAATLLRDRDEYGAWIHEAHHRAKRDAPSGTALMLEAALVRGGLTGPIDISSTRAGSIPGTHSVGFDGPAESLLLEHVVRDRSTFAHGALAAAQWVVGKRGWFTMRDVIGLGSATPIASAGTRERGAR